MRTLKQIRRFYRKQRRNPSRNWHNQCLVLTRSAFRVDAKYPSAAVGYRHTQYRHKHSVPPAGVPVWWTGGSVGYGHVVTSDGDGWCWTNDFRGPGVVSRERISDISETWTDLHYEGWTEDINDERVYNPAPPKPAVNFLKVREGVIYKREVTNGVLLKRAVAREVGPHLLHLSSPKLGYFFRRRYRRVQQKYLLLEHGQHSTLKEHSGIPDKPSLTWLCKRHDMKVD